MKMSDNHRGIQFFESFCRITDFGMKNNDFSRDPVHVQTDAKIHVQAQVPIQVQTQVHFQIQTYIQVWIQVWIQVQIQIRSSYAGPDPRKTKRLTSVVWKKRSRKRHLWAKALIFGVLLWGLFKPIREQPLPETCWFELLGSIALWWDEAWAATLSQCLNQGSTLPSILPQILGRQIGRRRTTFALSATWRRCKKTVNIWMTPIQGMTMLGLVDLQNTYVSSYVSMCACMRVCMQACMYEWM